MYPNIASRFVNLPQYIFHSALQFFHGLEKKSEFFPWQNLCSEEPTLRPPREITLPQNMTR